jgi:hypothetical protein
MWGQVDPQEGCSVATLQGEYLVTGRADHSSGMHDRWRDGHVTRDYVRNFVPNAQDEHAHDAESNEADSLFHIHLLIRIFELENGELVRQLRLPQTFFRRWIIY